MKLPPWAKGDALLFIHMHRQVNIRSCTFIHSYIYYSEGTGESLRERESPSVDRSYMGMQAT